MLKVLCFAFICLQLVSAIRVSREERQALRKRATLVQNNNFDNPNQGDKDNTPYNPLSPHYSSAPPPTLPHAFQAYVVSTSWNRTNEWQTVDHIFEDADNNMQRVDTHYNEKSITMLARYDQNTLFVIDRLHHACSKINLNGMTLSPWFSWVASTKKSLPCSVNGVKGDWWAQSTENQLRRLCYTTNINPSEVVNGETGRPLEVEMTDTRRSRDIWVTTTVFESFLAISPSPEVFRVPNICDEVPNPVDQDNHHAPNNWYSKVAKQYFNLN